MALKELFLSYVEQQRSANATREAHGPDDPRTVDAYQNANDKKRQVLNAIEALEKENV